MGSPKSETIYYVYERQRPQHEVTIAKPFAVGKYEVTRGEFADFVRATAHDAEKNCRETGELKGRADRSWRNPGFSQDQTHPVTCVAWPDAKAYVDWLSERTGKAYRLLSEAEWEYAARAETRPGRYPRFHFGDDESDLCAYANWARCKYGVGEKTAAVGSYRPNAFGLYDMHGNVNEWVEDCWKVGYEGAPSDGSASTVGDCTKRILRGGSWLKLSSLRSASRSGSWGGYRDKDNGIRVARTLTP